MEVLHRQPDGFRNLQEGWKVKFAVERDHIIQLFLFHLKSYFYQLSLLCGEGGIQV